MKPRLSPDLLCVIAIVALNAILIAPLFTLEYSSYMGSIEAAYISISHQWVMHGIDFGWWPLWYTGIPGQNTYPPLLHLLVAIVAKLFGISSALSHHIVTASLYCLGAAAVYWLVRAMTGQWTRALLVAGLYSLTAPSALLIPVVRHDMGSIFHPRRLHALLVYGEGPHVASVGLIPLALVLLHYAVTRRRGYLILPAALGMIAVVLTNWLGAFALAAAIFCYLLARPWKDWVLSGAIGVLAYAIASPWIPPSTLMAIRMNAQRIGGDFRFGATNLAWLAGLAGAAWLVSMLLRKQSEPIRFAAAFSVLIGGITLLGALAQINVLPQPERYHLEMEFGLVMLAGLLIPWRIAAIVFLAVFACYSSYRYSVFARRLIHPIDITQTSEYKEARWFDEHMKGRRVATPGSVSFWMNAFTDTPQLTGGFDQGIVNRQIPAAHFQILSGMNAGAREGEIAVAWLRAFGIHAVSVSGPRSTEVFKPFTNWKKFEGILKPIWRDGDDVVYEVPQRSASLARAIHPENLVMIPPEYAMRDEVLRPYLDAVDDPAMPDASWEWIDRSHARITGNFSKGTVLSIQMAYHPGWHAAVDGQSRRIYSDGIDLMVVDPECDGQCTVELAYDGGKEMQIARWVSATGLLIGLALVWRKMEW